MVSVTSVHYSNYKRAWDRVSGAIDGRWYAAGRSGEGVKEEPTVGASERAVTYAARRYCSDILSGITSLVAVPEAGDGGLHQTLEVGVVNAHRVSVSSGPEDYCFVLAQGLLRVDG